MLGVDLNFANYSPPVLQLAKETGVPCVALDYSELSMYTANLSDEDSFTAAIDKVFSPGQAGGKPLRLRIGPSEAEAVAAGLTRVHQFGCASAPSSTGCARTAQITPTTSSAMPASEVTGGHAPRSAKA
jgi:hypothetical protein